MLGEKTRRCLQWDLAQPEPGLSQASKSQMSAFSLPSAQRWPSFPWVRLVPPASSARGGYFLTSNLAINPVRNKIIVLKVTMVGAGFHLTQMCNPSNLAAQLPCE